MHKWNQKEDKEQAFKKRYNRKVKVFQEETEHKDITTLKISYGQDEYTIEETRKEGLTDFVIVSVGNKTYRYNRYIDAEVFIADLIGG